MNISALDLEQQHADALVHKQSEIQRLDAEIADYHEALEEARMEQLRLDPKSRSGSATSEVGQLSRQLESKRKQREALAKDVEAQQRLHAQLKEQAQAKRDEAELQAAQAEITETQDVAKRWTAFVKDARKLRDQWEPLCAATQRLDALPAGDTPINPFPGDLLRAFQIALKEQDGHDPFKSFPRVNPKRLPITRTQGMGAMDVTGYARDLCSTGQWQ